MSGSWDQIARRHGTGKVVHDYFDLYEETIPQPENVLEIGVCGGASLSTWAEIWPTAHIVGMDRDPASPGMYLRYEGDVTTICADATDEVAIERICRAHGPFDFICDDGSHILEEVRDAYRLLRFALRGVYVIEDLDGSDQRVRDFVTEIGAEWFPTNSEVMEDSGVIVVR